MQVGVLAVMTYTLLVLLLHFPPKKDFLISLPPALSKALFLVKRYKSGPLRTKKREPEMGTKNPIKIHTHRGVKRLGYLGRQNQCLLVVAFCLLMGKVN